jgi:hypothetical protein
MAIQGGIEQRLISLAQLIDLVKVKGPCISIYFSTYSLENNPNPLDARFRAVLEKAQAKLSVLAPDGQGDLYFRKLYDFANTKQWERQQGGLAIFCAPDFLRIFRTARPISESLHAGPTFYIRPLLPVVTRQKELSVLALSQKHIRLLKCVDGAVVRIELPTSLPRNVEEAGAFDVPDHDLENRAAAGSSLATLRRIHFGTGTIEEKSEAYICKFFKIIDRAINNQFKRAPSPLVLAGVDRETALYRKVSSYPHLLRGSVRGSPEGVTDSEIYRLAQQVLDAEIAGDEAQLLSRFSEKKSRQLILTDPQSILIAARCGQIHHLLLTDRNVKGKEELLNLAVIETIVHGGKVSLISRHPVLEGSPVVAMLRYQVSRAEKSQSHLAA